MEEFGVGAALTQALLGYGLTIVVAFATAGAVWLIVVTLEKNKARQAAKVAAVAAPAAVSVTVEPEPSKEDDTAKHVAAIAAAVYAVLGAHRLVHIAEADTQPGWRTTGRMLHQSSHAIRRGAKD